MKNKNISPKDSLKSILLRMNYDSKKTLAENLKFLSEQAGGAWAGTPGAPTPFMTNDVNDVKKVYPQDCAFPDKAVLPGTNKYGLKGLDAIPKNFCAYQRPSINCDIDKDVDNQATWILLPDSSKNISFFTTYEDYASSVDLYLDELSPESKNKINRDTLIEKFQKIIPPNSVKQFKLKSVTKDGDIVEKTYLPYVCYSVLLEKDLPSFIGFKGFFDEQNQPFVYAEKRDTRTETEKILDEWEGAIYFAQFLVAVVATAACNGCAASIWIDLIVSLGVGAAYTTRNFEKGEEVDAVLAAFFAVLPGLYFFKGLKGVTPKIAKELETKFARSGLTAQSSVAQYKNFTKSLSPEAQKVLNNLFRNDQVLFKELIKKGSGGGKDIVKAINAKFADMFVRYPKLIKEIPVRDRIWYKTMFLPAATAFIAAAGVNYKWGSQLNTVDSEKLTDEEKDKLDGIWEFIPEELKQEMVVNFFNKPENISQVINDPQWKGTEQEINANAKKNLPEALNLLFVKNKVREIFEKNGYKYEDFMTLDQEIKLSKSELEVLKKEGWVMADEWDDESQVDMTLFINGDLYYKIKKK
jgi:hypothetical protein